MPSGVRFSRAQKWELVRMSAAAIASTVFFTVPLFLVPSVTGQRTAQSSSTASTPAVIATNASPSALPAEIAPSTTPNTVAVVTATEFAVESTPVLQSAGAQSVRPRTLGERPSVLRARANVKAEPAPSPSFKHRLARFFSGVGKYAVKPFPTVANSGN